MNGNTASLSIRLILTTARLRTINLITQFKCFYSTNTYQYSTLLLNYYKMPAFMIYLLTPLALQPKLGLNIRHQRTPVMIVLRSLTQDTSNYKSTNSPCIMNVPSTQSTYTYTHKEWSESVALNNIVLADTRRSIANRVDCNRIL